MRTNLQRALMLCYETIITYCHMDATWYTICMHQKFSYIASCFPSTRHVFPSIVSKWLLCRRIPPLSLAYVYPLSILTCAGTLICVSWVCKLFYAFYWSNIRIVLACPALRRIRRKGKVTCKENEQE
jgi:hypothetical protein